MRSPFHTPFAAVFCNEVLLNAKRVAPYVMMVLFAANSVLWWGWGPAVQRGWATNSDFYISRNYGGFSIVLGLPIFTAIMMGDAVIRDFRLGVDPLIFSKPVGRASYLLGKFFGNFFVLVCCQSAFAITAFLLQWVPFSGMVKLPVRVVPYFTHFVFAVVLFHLGLAAIYFLVGTLSRNAKVVYVLAACFYPAFIGSALMMRNLPAAVRKFFAPFGLDSSVSDPWKLSADFLNNYVVTYSLTAYANRGSIIIVTALCLLIVYLRFRITPVKKQAEHFTKLTLSPAPDAIAYRSDPVSSYALLDIPVQESPARERVTLPKVTSTKGGTLFKTLAAVGLEFRLLRAERSLVVLFSLVILLCFLNLPPHSMVPDVSYSVMFATHSANTLLLLLTGLIVFYTGEAMHRDRELKIEPVVWPTPITNSVLLLSKWFAMMLLALVLVAVVGFVTIVVQLLRGHPLDLTAYLMINGVMLVPGLMFVAALVVALNVVLRNKYVAYVVATGIGAGLIYLYNMGYNHWLYNPLLYRLWKYADLTSGTILAQRLYSLALAGALLALAHVAFERKQATESTKKQKSHKNLC